MPKVTYIIDGEPQTVEFEHGKLPYTHHGKPESFLDVAKNFGVPLEHACGGSCACTTCHVIIREGAANLSEMEDDALQTRAHFAKRNRTIAAFADAVVVVQAPLGSGALITANEARRMSVPVFAVPAAPWDVRGLGFQELLRQGALICNSADDVLNEKDPARRQVEGHGRCALCAVDGIAADE